MLYHPLQRVDPICTTRLLLYKITTFCPNMTKITAADYMVSGCSISIQFLNLRTLKKPITNKTALINSIAVITIKWTFPVTHCAQL